MKDNDVIVLFSGCGGFSEGFKQAGFNIIYANDVWDVALQSHKLNHPDANHVLGDIRDIDEFPEASIVIGSPPCQNFSIMNTSRNEEHGLELVKEFERVVKIVKPDYWVWENVPGVKKYYRNACVLDAFDFGLPQHRKRCFVSNFSFIRMNTLKGVKTPGYIYDGGNIEPAKKAEKGSFRHITCSGTVRTNRIRDTTTNELLTMERVRELMGFPHDYILTGGVTLQQKQLGNAVCPPVARVIAEAIRA